MAKWDQLVRETEEAAKRTDRVLAGRQSEMLRLDREEISKLFPSKRDRERFLALMKIVRSSAADNERTNQIVAQIKELAPIILSVLGRIV